jgi:hypothetical protein
MAKSKSAAWSMPRPSDLPEGLVGIERIEKLIARRREQMASSARSKQQSILTSRAPRKTLVVTPMSEL